MANPKLKVAVNKNPTKEGLKVQFQFPQTMEGDARTKMTQKLQAKLTKGLDKYGMTISQDPDVPYDNVIGFMIPIADLRLLITNALTGKTQTPAETPIAPEIPAEEPIKEGQLNEMETETWKIVLGLLLPIVGIAWKIKDFIDIKDLQKQIKIIKKITGSSDYREFVKNDPKGPYTEKQIEKILQMQDKPGIGVDAIGNPKKNPSLPKFSPNE
jgi:hypothetical protein